MRRYFLIILFLASFTSCEKLDNTKKASSNKKIIDSLAIQKRSKTKEIKTLNYELDSLRKLSDSLKAISK